MTKSLSVSLAGRKLLGCKRSNGHFENLPRSCLDMGYLKSAQRASKSACAIVVAIAVWVTVVIVVVVIIIIIVAVPFPFPYPLALHLSLLSSSLSPLPSLLFSFFERKKSNLESRRMNGGGELEMKRIMLQGTRHSGQRLDGMQWNHQRIVDKDE